MMAKRRIPQLLLVLILSLLTAAQVMAEDGTRITWSVLSSGGGRASSSHYTLDFTLGQLAPDLTYSTNYRIGGGFWYVWGLPQVTQRFLYLPTILK